MAYHYKKKQKKHYKIKPLPVIIAMVTFILLVWLIGTVIMKWINPNDSNVDATSILTTVSDSTKSLSNSSEVPSQPPNSTAQIDDTSKAPVSSKAPPVSSKAPPVSNKEPVSVAPSSVTTESTVSSSNPPTDGSRPTGSKSDWNLILLNNDNKITKDLEIEKTKFDTQWVDSRAAQAYRDMRKGAEEQGITLYLRSGYRSMATQQRNYNNEVARYMGLGNSKEEATRLTNRFYALPGSSEHHSGLAFDTITPEYHNQVYTLNEQFAKTDAYKWLVKNSVNYGFVLRFPKDKQEITGINFEPWHYRYVGIEHAKYMNENNLCLEEYIAMFDE